MRKIILLSTQLILSILAQSLPQLGINSPGIGGTPEALKISEDAGRTPNDTSSITVTRYFNATENWTWRVNVTEISVPNDLARFGTPEANFSRNLHVVNTQWQLEWPGKAESLQLYLQERNMGYFFYTRLTNLPANITSRYDGRTNDGNCGPILGNDCVNSIIKATRGTSFRWSRNSGCESTLDVVQEGTTSTGSNFGWDLREKNASDLDSYPVLRNSTFLHLTSESYVAGNTTLLNQAKSALHILIMSPKYDASPRSGSTSGTALFCQIVEKSVVSGTSSDASSMHGSVVALWSIAMLTMLLVV